MSRPPSVREALTFAARLFRSGYRSDEAEALITLAREYYRLQGKLAALRDDRSKWRAIAVMLMGLCRTLRDIVIRR